MIGFSPNLKSFTFYARELHLSDISHKLIFFSLCIMNFYALLKVFFLFFHTKKNQSCIILDFNTYLTFLNFQLHTSSPFTPTYFRECLSRVPRKVGVQNLSFGFELLLNFSLDFLTRNRWGPITSFSVFGFILSQDFTHL